MAVAEARPPKGICPAAAFEWSHARLFACFVLGVFKEVFLHIEDQLFGRQRLVGEPGRAGILAPPAFCAGISVHQVFPPEVSHRRRAQCLLVLDLLLYIGDQLHLPLGREIVEEDVDTAL